MPRFIAFMRAVNVGGRFVKMATLAEHYRSLGYADVETFINSGNVIFSTRARSASKLEPSIEDRIEPLLGFASELFIRTPDEVAAILDRATEFASSRPESREVNVAFLKQPPEPARQSALDALQSDVDTFSIEGREVYWGCAVKQSDSRVSGALLERKLRQRTTVRRRSMLRKLVTRLQG